MTNSNNLPKEKMLLETLEFDETLVGSSSKMEHDLFKKLSELKFLSIVNENGVFKVYAILNIDMFFDDFDALDKVFDEFESNINCVSLLEEVYAIIENMAVFENKPLDDDLKKALDYAKAMKLVEYAENDGCLFLYSSYTLSDDDFSGSLDHLLSVFAENDDLCTNLEFLFSTAMEHEIVVKDKDPDFVIPFSAITKEDYISFASLRYNEENQGFITYIAFANSFYVFIKNKALKLSMQDTPNSLQGFDGDETTIKLLKSLPLKSIGGSMYKDLALK